MTTLVHPKDALFAGEKPFPIIPSCEHFAGSEKLISRPSSCRKSWAPYSISPATAKTAHPLVRKRRMRR